MDPGVHLRPDDHRDTAVPRRTGPSRSPPGTSPEAWPATVAMSQRAGDIRINATLRRFPPRHRHCPAAASRDTRETRDTRDIGEGRGLVRRQGGTPAAAGPGRARLVPGNIQARFPGLTSDV